MFLLLLQVFSYSLVRYWSILTCVYVVCDYSVLLMRVYGLYVIMLRTALLITSYAQDCNTEDKNRVTPLQLTMESGSLNILKFLVSTGNSEA